MEIAIICLCQILSFVAGAVFSGGFKLPARKQRQIEISEDEIKLDEDIFSLMNYFPGVQKKENEGDEGI